MDIYRDFAEVYDLFMEDTPYDEWTARICDTLKKYGITDGLIADLGCGTGAITKRLRDAGYDMIGIDASYDMLSIAGRESDDDQSDPGSDILYLCQDMRSFELYGTVRAIVSVCDSINYLTEYDDLRKTFSLVNNYLDPDGLFIFDFNTIHKYRDVIGDDVIAENADDCSFIWENYYNDDTHINEYDLTLFIKEGDLFRRSTETHRQRGYTFDEMCDILTEAGLKVLYSMDADTGKEVTQLSERVYMVARESGKNC